MGIRWISRFLCLAAGLLLLVAGCEKQTEGLVLPVPFEGRLSLQAEPGVVEAWLTLKLEGLPAGTADLQLVLMRDGTERLRFPAVAETTVVDTGLLPAHSYTYAARLEKAGHTAARSNSVQLTTMDTTSHDFQWEVVEFPSPFGSGVLYDVAIINENDIWAVGEIYSDSSQPWLPYNAVHWDGQKWELKRIYKENNNAIQAIRGVLTFEGEKFWFAAGSIYEWNRNNTNARMVYRRNINTSQTVEKLWGISANNLFGVGNDGLIVHYDGSGWRRIESGTDVDLLDVWGTPDGQEVWVCGWEDFKPTVLLKNEAGKWKTVFNSSEYLFTYLPDTFSGAIRSVWVDENAQLYVLSWFDLYRYRENPTFIKPLWGKNDPQIWASRSVRGTAPNNIFTASTPGIIWHFNGVSWRLYSQLIDSSVRLSRVAVTENLAIAAGYRYVNAVERKGLLYIGRRW